jgi:hypothetical protein
MRVCRYDCWTADEGGRAALARVLSTILVAVIASSCAMNTEERQGGDVAASPTSVGEYPAPPIEPLSQAFRDFLSEQGYDNVTFVTIAYAEDERENLIAFGPSESDQEAPIEVGEFVIPSVAGKLGSERIPPVGTEFQQAIVLFISSPTGIRSCGTGGGSQYCRF